MRTSSAPIRPSRKFLDLSPRSRRPSRLRAWHQALAADKDLAGAVEGSHSNRPNRINFSRGRWSLIYIITQTLNGLFSAALLFLIASGLTLVFGVMRIVNIAHGSFYMLGVYVAYTIVARTHSLLLGASGAILVVASIGFGVERLFLRRSAAKPLAQMMLTM